MIRKSKKSLRPKPREPPKPLKRNLPKMSLTRVKSSEKLTNNKLKLPSLPNKNNNKLNPPKLRLEPKRKSD
jgi:hypothetical protein